MKKAICILLFAIIFCISFYELNVLAEAKTSLSVQELQDDYDQMWDILYESYPFLPCTGKSEEELEALRQEKRALIGSKVTDSAGLYLIMQDICRALGNIAHLRALGPEEYSSLYYSGLQDQENGINKKDNEIYLDPQTVETYTQLGFMSVKPVDTTDLSSVTMDYFPEIQTAYFRIPTFYSRELYDQGMPIAEFLDNYPDVENVIFDITGNRGGYGYIWTNHIVSAFSDPVDWQVTSYIRITDPVAWTYEGVDVEPIDPETTDLPDWVNTLGMTHQSTQRISLPYEDYAGKKVDKSIKRWIVTDENVASSAEVFTRFCKDTGWATIVGTATKGDGPTSAYSPSPVRLNHTGLLFWFFVESGVNEDGTLNALQGTMPDFFSKPNEKPLDACIRWIKQMNSNYN